ncbi:MAG: hypothetical protein ACFFD6_04400, partial [Candidatus Thorarchaeota archaeon]
MHRTSHYDSTHTIDLKLEPGMSTDYYAQASNEKVLFLMNRLTGVAPYAHEFVIGDLDPQMLSGFVGAMGSFLGEFLGTEHSQWKTVYGSDVEFIVEGGEWILGVLAVTRETSELRNKVRSIVAEFEDSFRVLKTSDGLEGGLFKEFDNFVRRVFTEDRLIERTIALKGLDWQDINTKHETPSIGFSTTKLLHEIEHGESLGAFAKSKKRNFEEIRDTISYAYWKGIVYLLYVPAEDDILCLSEGAHSILFKRENHLQLTLSTIRIVGAIDGRSKLSEVIRRCDLSESPQILREIGLLVNRGFLQRVT